MKHLKVPLALCLLAMATAAFALQPEQPAGNDDLLQVKLIKVKRMSRDWPNKPVMLRLYDGSDHQDLFLAMQGPVFRLNTGDGIREYPVSGVSTVVLKRRTQDLLLVGLTALGSTALFAGAASLGFDATGSGLIGASAVGAVFGFTFGWKGFYKDVIIPLD